MVVSEQQFKILIAEDSSTDRMILESIVTQIGHIPILAEDGKQAIELFEKNKPDIILMDVLMPDVGGMEATTKIREMSKGELLPILFLTSLTDTQSVVECLEAGGDDFVSKPYNATILRSKIRAFGRMREMHNTLAEQKSKIELNHKHLIQEQNVAKQVFDKIAHTGCLDLENIRYHMSPLAVFNGDVLVAEVSPAGSMMVLLGDFTGHGLPAAIGSMPLASTFYGMVHKGFSISEIMREINSKLHQILPVGFFCCATCIDINFTKRRIRVWNGGLPESYLYRKRSDIYERVSTNHLPLGVLPRKEFNADTLRLDLEIGDRFYMYSDGITEARNIQGEMFGEERMHAVMEENKGKTNIFSSIMNAVQTHIGDFNAEDDLSLVEIIIDDIELSYKNDGQEGGARGNLVDWSMSFEITAETMKGFDPLPLLINLITEVPGLRQNSTTLYTILSELYANALEHGVLGMTSEIKSTPEGFVEFFKIRREKLSALQDAKISFFLKHKADDAGGVLNIRVKDSGKGFNVPPPQENEENRNYHGRGLSIMKSTCDNLIIHPPGNDVEVAYRWNYEE